MRYLINNQAQNQKSVFLVKINQQSVRVYSHNLQSRINVCIKKIQSYFTCIFIGEMRLDNSLYAYVYGII